MPKLESALTKPKTGPGQSYLLPETRVLAFECEPDGSEPFLIVALDALECAFLERAARDVVKATFPRSGAEIVMPTGDHHGCLCLYSRGQFPVVMRDAQNRPIDDVSEGATVRFRVMLKAFRVGERIEVVAFPSRLDVISQPLARKVEKIEPAQLAMTLEPPPVAKPVKAPKPKAKAPPKPKPQKAPPPFDKAAYARHRAEVVQARARQRAKAAETPAVSLGPNVIVFPISPTKH